MKSRVYRHVLAGSALLAIAAGAAPAQSIPVLYCKDGPGIDLVSAGCVSGTARGYPGGGDGIYSNSGGGDSGSAVQQAILGATGATVTLALYGKSDANPGLFAFAPLDPATATSGTWDVLNNSVLIKYITVKAANSFALYELPGAGANSGSFTTAGLLNNGGQQPQVSHISFWTAIDPRSGAIPEPAQWAMMLSGLALIGFTLRRHRNPMPHTLS